jgi:hypothetical protein
MCIVGSVRSSCTDWITMKRRSRTARVLVLALCLAIAGCSSGSSGSSAGGSAAAPTTMSPQAAGPGDASDSPPAAQTSSPAAVAYDHEPGAADVSTMTPGKEFDARPNFHYFSGCLRPCRMPIYPKPALVKGTSISPTTNWPCEARSVASRTLSQDQYCADRDDPHGDWVHVYCQVQAPPSDPAGSIWNDNNQSSNVWDGIKIMAGQLGPNSAATVGLVPDIWFGDTSRDPTTHKASLKVRSLRSC